MCEVIDLTGDGGVLKTIIQKAKSNAIEPTESLAVVDGKFPHFSSLKTS